MYLYSNFGYVWLNGKGKSGHTFNTGVWPLRFLRFVVPAVAPGKSARAVKLLCVDAAYLMERLAMATYTRLFSVVAPHDDTLRTKAGRAPAYWKTLPTG